MSCTDKELEYARKHREKYPDAVKLATKKWREKNKERVAENVKRWKSENKDRVEASRQRFHKLNPGYKHEYQRKWWATPTGRYLTLKIVAKNKKLELDITFDQWQEIVSKPCSYCGQVISTNYGYSLDRVDSNKGYTIDNVVPCCALCNQMKSSLSRDEFITHIKRIIL